MSLLQHKIVKPVHIDNTAAKGHCKAIRIMPPGSDCLITWGTYVPHDTTERAHLYDMLKTEVKQAEGEVRQATYCQCFSIMPYRKLWQEIGMQQSARGRQA